MKMKTFNAHDRITAPAIQAAGALMVGLACSDVLAVTIFPTPRSLTPVGSPMMLVGPDAVAPVIVPVNVTEMMQAGIDVIQARLEEVGAPPWPIVDHDETRSGTPVIYVAVTGADPRTQAWIDGFGGKVTPSDPGTQGYVIVNRFENGRRDVLVVGSDETGMLYGCVTLAHFIAAEAQKGASFQPHDVRDWPDFKHRMLGSSGPLRQAWEPYDKLVLAGRHDEAAARVEELDAVFYEHVNWMLLNKINLVNHYVPSFRNAAQKKRMDRWVQYMRARGIGLTWCQSSPVGSAAENRRGCVKMGSTEYCWSDDARHQAQAIQRANIIRDLGVRHFALHMIDADGPDPEHWSQRCDACRRRFGDDRAAANVNIFMFYYEAIRERAPDCRIEFIPVPYKAWPFYQQGTMELSIEWLEGNPEAAEKHRMSQAALDYFRRLDALLPEDVIITLREHGRQPSSLYRRAFNNRPLAIWWWQFPVRGWQTFFHNMGRHAKTWDFNDPRDLIFVTSHDLPVTERLITLFNNEYVWNTDAPGSAVLEEAYDYRIGDGLLEPKAVTFPFLEAAARKLYGTDAGAVVAEVCKQPLSIMFVARPRVTRVINGEAHNLYTEPENLLVDLLSQMRIEAKAADRAASVCAAYFAGQPPLTGAAARDLPVLYRSAVRARHVALARVLRASCDRALVGGDTASAKRFAEAGIRFLDAREAEVAAMVSDLAAYPPVVFSPGSVENDLEQFDFTPYRADFADILDRADAHVNAMKTPMITAHPFPLRLPLPLEPAGGLMSHTTAIAARETGTGLELTFTVREDDGNWPALRTRRQDEWLTGDAGEQGAYVGLYVRTAESSDVLAFLFDWKGNRLGGRSRRETIAEVATADWDPRWAFHVVSRPNLGAGLDRAWNGTWSLNVAKQSSAWTATVVLPWETLASLDGTVVDRDGIQFVIERYWRSREPFGPGEYGRLGDFDGVWIPWKREAASP